MAKAPAQRQYTMQDNYNARNLILQTAVDAWQQIYSQSFTSGTQTTINVPLRNVGLVKRLVVEVAAQISGSGGVTHTLTKLGAANFFSSVVLTDLSNQTRIQTTGWHLTAVATAKSRMGFGSAITSTDSPFGYGNNYQQTNSAPTLITGSAASNNVFIMFEVPVSYSDDDLRGAIFANVVNATFNLQLTVNPNLLVASAFADPVFSMYQSSSATVATMPSFTVTVYQNFLDQLPVGNGGAVLPLFDISTAYLLNNTSFSGLVTNTDNPIPYANFRDFLSTTVIYDNAGVLTANGTDVNYFAIQSANYTNIIKLDTKIISLLTRKRLQQDMPTGMYYFDHRNKPISTAQYGNMALNANLNTVTGSTSQLAVGFESLALINMVTNAGALPGS